jgi:hypothetical protein
MQDGFWQCYDLLWNGLWEKKVLQELKSRFQILELRDRLLPTAVSTGRCNTLETVNVLAEND